MAGEIEWADDGGVEWAAPKGVAESPAADKLGEELKRRGKAALGGIEAAASMASSIPQQIWKGYSGLGALMTGNDVGAAMNRAEQQVPAYTPHTEFGQTAMEALNSGREFAGDLAGDNAALRSANEAAFDVMGMMIPFGRGKGRLTPHEQANMEAAIARMRAKPTVNPEVEWAKQPAGTQGELGLQGGRTSPMAEPAQAQGPDVYQMMDNLNEKLDYQRQQANGPQADLFDQNNPDSFPGVERSRILKDEELKQEGTIPYEDGGLSLADTEATYDTWRPSQTPEFSNPEGLDWAFKQEQVEKDPYVKTLKDEATKAFEENQRIHRWAKAHGWTPNTLRRANEAADRVQEVTQLAKEYLVKGLNVSKPDHYSGSMYSDPLSRPVENGASRSTSVSSASQIPSVNLPNTHGQGVRQVYRIEKTPVYRTGKAGFRQGGSVDFTLDDAAKKAAYEKAREEGILDETGKPIDHLATWRISQLAEGYKNDPEFKQKILGGVGKKGFRQGGAVDFWSPKKDKEARLKELDDLIAKNQKAAEALESLRDKGTYSDSVDKRLERLYYEQMKYHNEKIRLTDPDHPLNKLGGPGKKGFRQGGTVSLKGKGIDYGGYENLPDRLKDWVYNLAESKAMDLMQENGVDKTNPRDFSHEEQVEFVRYVGEMMKNPDFIKQAINLSGGANYSRGLTPPYELGTKGWIGKQQGAIRLGNDPEFLKFRRELPLPLKDKATKLYKEWKKQQKPTQPQVYDNEDGLRAMQDVPGVKDWKDEIAPIMKSPAEIKPDILKEPDIGESKAAQLGRQLVSGGKLYGFGTQNTLIRYSVQQMDNAIRAAYNTIHDVILDKNTGFKVKWERMNKEEFAEAWAVMKKYEGIKEPSAAELHDEGLNDKQVDAILAYRQADNLMFDKLNEGRAAAGKEPFQKRLGHIPSRFRGDFIVEARDADGSLVHRIGAMSMREAEKARSIMEEKYPELTFSDPVHEPLHRFKDASDAQAGYQAMLESLSDSDPRVAALESTWDEYLKKQAYTALGVKKHFLNKKGVGGAEGFKDWENAVTNAYEGLRSTMNYMDHAMKWAEFQKVRKPLAELLKDKEILEAQPNTVKYVQSYIDQALGRSTRLARHLDGLLDVVSEGTGIGQSAMLKNIRQVKYAMTAYYLGFMNAGFSLSQMVQVMQTIPSWQLMFKQKGANASIIKSWAMGAFDASIGFALGREKMSPLAEGAWDYAKQYGIVEPKILDEVRTWKDRSVQKILEGVSTWNMTAFEKFARTQAYFSWVHFLYDSGRFTPGNELYKAAADLTDMTMVDYRQHERPMLYKQLGIMGESANALTTFKHNYYSQLWALKQHASPRLLGDRVSQGSGSGPMATFLGTTLALSGAIGGLFGREDIDGLIHWLNKIPRGSWMPDYRIPTTRELIMKMPDALAFGGASAVTGMDLSGKFSAGNIIPDSPMTAMFPFAGTTHDIAASAINAVMDPNLTNFARLGYTLAPQSFKSLVEKNAFTTKEGMTLDPTTLEGKYRRTPGDWYSRYFGVRSMNESRQMQDNRTLKDVDNYNAVQRNNILDNAKGEMFMQTDPQKRSASLQKYARSFFEHEGTIDDFISKMEENKQNQRLTPAERMRLKALDNEMKAKRLFQR